MKILKEYSFALINPKLASTAIRVAIVVGSILFTINHGHALIKRKMTRDRWLSGLLTLYGKHSWSVFESF
ncbi:MAG: nitrate/nitrite transporter NrtS [Xenococcus sp. MO_188.B8]|nr:nitrate/nitrite transporter NrtS [Xenococcus sp. MO_188.B8]